MTKAKPVTTFKTDADGVLIATHGETVLRFREPLGSDLVKVEKQLKKQETEEEEETDAEMLSIVLEILGTDDITAEGYLSLPLTLYKAIGAEVMSTFRD